MKNLVSLLIGVVLALSSAASRAQLFEAVDSPTPACMSNGGRVLAYPLLLAKEAAVVRVELTYTSPDEDPVAKVSFRRGDVTAAEVVLDYVSRSRWPCLPKGHEVRVIQEFQFVPGPPERVVATDPIVTEHQYRGKVDCTAQIRSLRTPRLDFGLPGNWERVQRGKVLVELTFRSPDAPPEMRVLFGQSNRSLVEVVRRAVAHYQLPCASQDHSVVAVQSFRYDGEEPPPSKQLKPELSLVEFVSLLGDPSRFKNRFDLDSMGCPFKIRFAPWMPHAPNFVEELGTPNANRRFFLEWVKGVTLNLPPAVMDTAAGEYSVISVPCGLIDFSK